MTKGNYCSPEPVEILRPSGRFFAVWPNSTDSAGLCMVQQAGMVSFLPRLSRYTSGGLAKAPRGECTVDGRV